MFLCIAGLESRHDDACVYSVLGALSFEWTVGAVVSERTSTVQYDSQREFTNPIPCVGRKVRTRRKEAA